MTSYTKILTHTCILDRGISRKAKRLILKDNLIYEGWGVTRKLHDFRPSDESLGLLGHKVEINKWHSALTSFIIDKIITLILQVWVMTSEIYLNDLLTRMNTIIIQSLSTFLQIFFPFFFLILNFNYQQVKC